MQTENMHSFRDEMMKIAAPTTSTILPRSTVVARTIGSNKRLTPQQNPVNLADVHRWFGASAVPQRNTPSNVSEAATIAPPRMGKLAGLPPPLPAAAKTNPMQQAFMQGAQKAKVNPFSTMKLGSRLRKMAAELTEEARSKLPGKDFAVKAKSSNTGKEAYPIPDRQHARSALGFAKMHHDSADLEKVRAKVRAKYPDMLKAAGSSTVKLSGIPLKDVAELGGLGVLALPSVDELQAHTRAALSGEYNKEGVKKREVLPPVMHPLADVAGLGVLAKATQLAMREHP